MINHDSQWEARNNELLFMKDIFGYGHGQDETANVENEKEEQLLCYRVKNSQSVIKIYIIEYQLSCFYSHASNNCVCFNFVF